MSYRKVCYRMFCYIPNEDLSIYFEEIGLPVGESSEILRDCHVQCLYQQKILVKKKEKSANITKIGETAALSGVGERSIKNVNLPYSSFSQDHLQSFNPPPQEISFEHLMDAVSLYIKNLPKKKAELEKYKEKLLLAIDKQFSIPSAVSPVNRNFFCIHLWFTNFLLALVVDMYVCL